MRFLDWKVCPAKSRNSEQQRCLPGGGDAKRLSVESTEAVGEEVPPRQCSQDAEQGGGGTPRGWRGVDGKKATESNRGILGVLPR